jgi:hypothetical protein
MPDESSHPVEYIMANQVDREPAAEQIDDFLSYVAAARATVPDEAVEWESWDEEPQPVYRFQ